MNSAIVRPPIVEAFPPSQPNASASPGQFWMRDVARSFRMHRGLALLVSLAAFVALAAFALLRPPYYETSALVYVQPEKARLVTDPEEGAFDQMQYDSYLQQQIQTILRTDTLEDAIKLAAVDSHGDFWTQPHESSQSAGARLKKDLKVERVMGSYQISVTLDGRNPAWTTNLVNAVVETYITKERADELAQSDQQLDLLKKDRQSILSDLSDNSTEQAELSSNLGVVDLTPNSGNSNSSGSAPSSPFDAQLTQLRTQLDQAKTAHDMAQAQLASVTGTSPESVAALNAAADESYGNDPGLAAMRQIISQRRSELATQMAGLTPTNPLFKQDQAESARLEESLDKMSADLRAKAAQRVVANLTLQSARTGDVVARLAAQLAQQTTAATGATPKLQRAAFLAANIARLQARFTEVDNAINALELEHNSSGLVHLLLQAEVPTKPKVTKKWFILAGALPLAIVFGLMAAWLRHKLDPRIYIAEDIPPVLGFPPMAVLPAFQGMSDKAADEFLLRLVAGIDQAHHSGNARTFVLTPVSSSTRTAELMSSLVVRMERLGYRSLILKASAALQSLSANNEAPAIARGEKDAATRDEAQQTALVPTSLVRTNLEKLKQNVDLLFIEAQPLLSSAEAEFAARVADVTVLVVESGQTTAKELAGAMALARRLNVAGIAAILCDVQLRYADPQFAAALRGVEPAVKERRRRDEIPSLRGKPPLSIYTSSRPLASESESSSRS